MRLRREVAYAIAPDGTIWIGRDGWALPVRQVSGAADSSSTASGTLAAPMPGLVLAVRAAVGATVKEGDPIVVLESMKMEIVLAAPMDGVVADVSVVEGDRVTVGHVVATVEPASEEDTK